MTLCFTHAAVLDVESGGIEHDCDVVIEGNRIAARGASVARGLGGRHIDARDLLLLPGLVNAHTHSPECLAKGRDEGSTLSGWLASIWGRLDALSPRQIRIAAWLGAVEMIRTGTVAVLDHFRQTPMRPEAITAVVDAYHQVGMRALVAVMLRDRVNAVVKVVLPAHEQLVMVENAAAQLPATDRVRIALGPSAPDRCSDDLLSGAGELAQRRHLLIHTHVDETREEAQASRAHYGRSPLAHLQQLGLATPALSLAHCVWIEDADIELLARHGPGVVHNPVSNMRLGSGIAPVARLRRRGVPVAIGTDGAASNDGQNMSEAMKSAALLERVGGAPPADWMSAADALAMSTHIPARMLGFPCSQLKPGDIADLIAIRRSCYALTPANDIRRQIVYGGSGLDVRHVVIDGELVLDDGRITTIDEASVLAEAHEEGERLWAPKGRAA